MARTRRKEFDAVRAAAELRRPMLPGVARGAEHEITTGVQQDKDAVFAGLTLPWSTGPVEGQVNRLKLIKRSMYGQADLDLLKRRVLHLSPKSLERKNKKKQAQQEAPLKILKEKRKETLNIPQM